MIDDGPSGRRRRVEGEHDCMRDSSSLELDALGGAPTARKCGQAPGRHRPLASNRHDPLLAKYILNLHDSLRLTVTVFNLCIG